MPAEPPALAQWWAGSFLFSKFAFGYQKRSSLITVGTSHGFAVSFAILSAASHRWRVHSSATMVSATLNLPCVGHSKPVAWPVSGSSWAGDLQIGQTRDMAYA